VDTYLSAYHILRDVREGLGEFSADLMHGVDTSGAYSNTWLTRRINEAQFELYAALLKVIPDEFFATSSITAVSSELELPWDFGRIIQLRDANGSVVVPRLPRELPADASGGSKLRYYRKGRSLYLTRSAVNDSYTLYYRRMPREIHAGKAGTGSTTDSIVLDDDFAPTIADYYNDMVLENLTQDWTAEVTDYSAARAATVSATAAKDDIYGLVSELPEAFHYLIGPRALIEARIQSSNPKKPVGPNEIPSWQKKVLETLSSFNLAEDKLVPESLWSDVGAGSAGISATIPGHTDPVTDIF
jgi:hypothetical protein